jgi:GAF domain-containing protein
MTSDTSFNWARLTRQAEGLLSVYRHRNSNAANLSALMFSEIPDISWVGFYFLENNSLWVGPFQGKPACTKIELGKGVCGTAMVSKETIRVEDVNTFDGHIACDAAANSEVVVPLIKNGEVIGVLDIDSASLSRFSEADAQALTALAQVYIDSID